MTRDSLHSVLEELVDDCSAEDADWADVVARARAGGPPPRRRRITWRRVAVVAAVAGAAATLLATPAFGLREALVRLVERTELAFRDAEPAPKPVRYRFAELSLGAPPGMDPEAIAGQARVIRFRSGGRQWELNLTPTRRGGFCYELERTGGCHADRLTTPRPVSIGSTGRQRREQPFELLTVHGTVHDARIAEIAVEFRDRPDVSLEFVWISRPIDAGFFAYALPADRRTRGRGPVAVVARDEDGKLVAREALRYPNLRRLPPRGQPQVLPSRPRTPLQPPFQRASALGVAVTAGQNGVVIFDATRLERSRARLLDGRSASFGCFRLVRRDGETIARGVGVGGRFRRRVGLELRGVGTPFDGCDIKGSYGNRWPGRLNGHSAVELAFTPSGRRYFEDRAAARDLALFLRSRAVRALRRQGASALVAGLRRRYAGRIAELRRAGERPPRGQIGYAADGADVVFSRISETGRRFDVRVRDGRIVAQNIGELASVY